MKNGFLLLLASKLYYLLNEPDIKILKIDYLIYV